MLKQMLKPFALASRKENFNEVFTPNETPDQRCDVILVVEDGKEFKAHKQALSEASPFFEKLLNSDMKESREGIVRLEMFSASAMSDTLEFIYTGDVQILAEENARDLVVLADYLFLPNLKTLAEAALVEMWNTSNCISAYNFSQRYHCEELLAKTEKYILANFTSVYETNREEVLNMSSKEMEMWLSSDEINVITEEEVFKIILSWIDHDRNKRQKYFAELFRHVRLVFASRDFLSTDILTNDLVKDNECCLSRVADAISLIDSQNCGNLSILPRKSLETSVIVVTSAVIPNVDRYFESSNPQPVLCYFPGEGRWCKLGEIPNIFSGKGELFFHRGKLPVYSEILDSFQQWCQLTRPLVCYNPYSNSWHGWSPDRGYNWNVKARVLLEIFVVNDNEIYALVAERRKVGSSIVRYKVESNSWEVVTSFLHLVRRRSVCIVAKDDFVYFIGGEDEAHNHVLRRYTDVHRYNLSRNQWDRVADFLQPKMLLSGAACNGRIFITGAFQPVSGMPPRCQCEVYSETTNEWQSIASLNIRPVARPKLLSVDDKLYALCTWNEDNSPLECYDPDKNKWICKTEVPIRMLLFGVVNAYSARIFKGFLSNHQLKSVNSRRCFPPASSMEASECKCVIM